MDGALTVKSINYGKVNLHIKSDGDINKPTITTEHFPYMGKKTYYPFPTFRVNYKGILPSLKTTEARGCFRNKYTLSTNVW